MRYLSLHAFKKAKSLFFFLQVGRTLLASLLRCCCIFKKLYLINWKAVIKTYGYGVLEGNTFSLPLTHSAKKQTIFCLEMLFPTLTSFLYLFLENLLICHICGAFRGCRKQLKLIEMQIWVKIHSGSVDWRGETENKESKIENRMVFEQQSVCMFQFQIPLVCSHIRNFKQILALLHTVPLSGVLDIFHPFY